MKKILKVISTFLFSLMFIGCIPTKIQSEPTPNLTEGFIVFDTITHNPIPERFRNIPYLNISGSAQFEPFQIENLKNEIKVLDTYIVDLRQECHGFLTDNNAVSFYNTERLLNNGFNSEETLASENKKFGSIKSGEFENIFNKRGKFIKNITVEKSEIELNLVKSANLDYTLFATQENNIPTPTLIDSFVSFITKTPASTHLHFHCDYGEGRTTMFMAMFQMMKESQIKSLDEILEEQLAVGGIVLTYDTVRSNFLQDFYDYTKANSNSNFKIPFSVWSLENSKSIL